MKMSRLISIALLGVALVATPVYAQRGGGGRSSGGSSSSYSGGGSRGGGGYSSSSRGSGYSSSSSSSGYRSSSPSYSSSRSSSPSYSTSRSSSSPSSSYTPSRSSSYDNSSSRSSSSYDNSGSRSSNSYSRGSSISGSNRAVSRSGSVPDQVRSRATTGSGRNGAVATRGGEAARGGNSAVRSGNTGAGRVGGGRPGGEPNVHPNGGHGGPVPPSHRPMHPAPYFWHPHHHCMVHCHRLYWDPCPLRPFYWPGFWWYCDSYWYDYHVTDIRVVHEYVKETYSMDLIAYAMSGDYMYALVNDPDGHTYIQIYDKSDKMLAEQQVSRKYIKMEVDAKNGGCWIMKKKDKDPLLFLYIGGELMIYEADK